jgi:putative transcriptional regulator
MVAKREKINRLKSVLAEKDISHKDFAKQIGVTPNTVTRYCNNVQQPTLILLRKMALALDLDIHELLVPTKK